MSLKYVNEEEKDTVRIRNLDWTLVKEEIGLLFEHLLNTFLTIS